MQASISFFSALANLTLEYSLGRQPQWIVPVELHKQIVLLETRVVLFLIFLHTLLLWYFRLAPRNFILNLSSFLFFFFLKLEVEDVFESLPDLYIIEVARVWGKLILVIEEYIDDEHSVDACSQWIKIEIGDVFNLENDVGWEVVALDSLVIYLSVWLVDELAQLLVLWWVDALSRLARPFLVVCLMRPGKTPDVLCWLLLVHRIKQFQKYHYILH